MRNVDEHKPRILYLQSMKSGFAEILKIGRGAVKKHLKKEGKQSDQFQK